MRLLKTAIVLLIVLNFVIQCSKDEKSPTNPDNNFDKIEKSPKRGISYNLTNAEDFEALKNGVTWWYNWYYQTEATEKYFEDYQMEFIPMVWGGNPSNEEITLTKSFILQHDEIEYLLVMNEPNLIDQANRTPQQAADDWIIYERIISDLAEHGREIKLVGPAMNWGTMTNYSNPVVWMDAFLNAYQIKYGREPLIDYLAFHWYDYGLKSQLNSLQKYGKQIWITEMANWNAQINSYAKQSDQMRQMVALCENRDDVFRYAWFIGRGEFPDNNYTYLFEEEPGVLTSLGELYISLPY